eukprot:TRINITY_DN5370_c0_g1_i1.p1 TRINITY_DN5370_c0_g1~~TRINITY_DN5370_c0_g1_i1.p1  ORF type:complete len:476 (-),score=-12.82 TRINITY_DN5370_c0_g1_i1:66-1493(-)
MFWTLGLIVCLGIGVGAAYLYKFIIIDAKKNKIPYPSDSLIDQALPTEIMHLIVLESDVGTLLNISEVSKYWNYLSNEHFIRDAVYKREGNYRPTKEEFEADQIRENFVPYESMEWLPYEREIYSHDWLVADQRLALQHNKKIIDASFSSLFDFKRALSSAAPNDTNNRVAKYLFKVRMRAEFISIQDHWKFCEGNGGNAVVRFIAKTKVKPEWQRIKQVPVEIIGELSEVGSTIQWFHTIHRYRVIDTRKRIAGMIPIDAYMWVLAFIILSPTLLLDLWSFSIGFQYVVNYIWAFISLVFTLIFSAVTLWKGKDTPWILAAILAMALAGGIIFAPWLVTLRISLFIGALHIVSFYWLHTYEYIRGSYHKHAIAILGYIGIMILFMVDWKMTADALKSGTILKTLLNDGIIYIVYTVFLLYLNIGRNLAISRSHQQRWSCKNVTRIDIALKIYLIVSAVTSVIIGFSAPNMYDAL